jgi:hypothetical protein
VAEHNPNPASRSNTAVEPGIPGSAVPEHPTDAIPLPPHGFATLDGPVRELIAVPAAEVISRVAVLLMNASAEKLGLVPGEEPDLDLAEARQLITALAGLLAAARSGLDDQWEPLHQGLQTLQDAFREASVRPDAPGEGPGEQLLS